MHSFVMALVVLAALALSGRTAAADELHLIMTTITLPNTPASQKYHDWADRINARGKGVVNIDVRDGMNLASSANFYDRLQSDVMQISFGSLNYLAGKFRLSQVMALPFLFHSAEEGSAVAWRLYKLGLLDTEFDQLVPLFFQVFPQQSLHLVKAPATPLTDLKGLKIIASGQTGTSVIAALGATPLSIPLSDTYEALQRSTADGLSFPMAPLHDFKLDEVTHYHIMAELGGGPGGVWMAEAKYLGLPQDVRKLIDENSGEPESRAAGRMLDQLQEEIPKRLETMKNQVVTTLSPELAKQWQAQVSGVATGWAANAGKERADALLAKARELAMEVQAGK